MVTLSPKMPLMMGKIVTLDDEFTDRFDSYGDRGHAGGDCGG